MRSAVVILACALVISAFGSDSDKVPLRDLVDRAVAQSKLTVPGGTPFHLIAEIVETTNPSSEYQAKVEIYWISPEKWRRTIEAPGFSQMLVINGDQLYEKDAGDYLPWWLNELLTAMQDPLPMADVLKQMNGQVPRPRGGQNSSVCADLRSTKGGVFCFEGSHGLLTSVYSSEYGAEFKDFKGFAGKRVARLIIIYPESGTTIQSRVTELTEFHNDDPTMFSIPDPTPPQGRIKSLKVNEATIRRLVSSGSEIKWPPIESKPTKGTCDVYISADRAGRIREVWPRNCDNAGLQDGLRETVKKWQLTPAAENGVPVQVEGPMSFTFGTNSPNEHPSTKAPATAAPTPATEFHIDSNHPPMVPPRVVKIVKPDCSIGRSCHGVQGDAIVIINVLADGTVGEVYVNSGDPRLFEDAIKAAKQCVFQAGTLLGKPTSMNFNLKYEF